MSCESIADKYNDFILDVAGTGQHIPASWVQSFLCLAQAGIFRVSGTMHTPVRPLVTGFSNDSFAKLQAHTTYTVGPHLFLKSLLLGSFLPNRRRAFRIENFPNLPCEAALGAWVNQILLSLLNFSIHVLGFSPKSLVLVKSGAGWYECPVDLLS